MRAVFISYVREDSEVVTRLSEELQSCGVQVWLDKSCIAPGLSWRDAINNAIRDGAFFLACFSRSSNERDRSYMFEELNVAVEELRQRSAAKPWFISIRLDDCAIPDIRISSTTTLRDLQWIDLFHDWTLGVKQLVKTINPFGNIDCIREALKLFGIHDYLSARSMLHSIASVGADLPPRVRCLVHYNLACAESRLAYEQRADDKKHSALLDNAVKHLVAWLAIGAGGVWGALDRAPSDEVNAMANDDDLLHVRLMRGQRIEQAIQEHLGRSFRLPAVPTGRSGGGCVLRGTPVATSNGHVPIEKLRVGDLVLSLDVASNRLVETRLKAIHVSRRTECFALNGSLYATGGHRVLVPGRGWASVDALSIGDRVVAEGSSQVALERLKRCDGYFEIYSLTTDHETHNYFAGGVLSHNIKA